MIIFNLFKEKIEKFMILMVNYIFCYEIFNNHFFIFFNSFDNFLFNQKNYIKFKIKIKYLKI